MSKLFCILGLSLTKCILLENGLEIVGINYPNTFNLFCGTRLIPLYWQCVGFRLT